MNLLSSFLVFIFFAFAFPGSMIPDNGSSVIIFQEKEEYVYYKPKKGELKFSKLDSRYSSQD